MLRLDWTFYWSQQLCVSGILPFASLKDINFDPRGRGDYSHIVYTGMCHSTGYTFYSFDWSRTAYKITLYLWKRGIFYICLTLKQGQFFHIIPGHSWSSLGEKLHVHSPHHFEITKPATNYLSGTGQQMYLFFIWDRSRVSVSQRHIPIANLREYPYPNFGKMF